MERNVWGACASAILAQALFVCVQKILLIPFGPPDAARADSEVIQTNGFSGFAYSLDGSVMEDLIFHDSTRANLFARQFELRLDDGNKCRTRLRHRNRGRDYFSNPP